MKLSTFIILFFAVTVACSCNKKPNAANNEQEELAAEPQRTLQRLATTGVNGPYDNYVAIMNSYTANPLKRSTSYTTQAFGKISTNGVAVNAGPLTIGSTIIYPGSNNLYAYTFPMSAGVAMFGTSVQASVNDSAVAAAKLRKVIMVVPKEIYPSSIPLPGSTINRLNSYTVNWAPDPNNQYHKVLIELSYYKGLSQYNASGMPASINNLVYTVADNGTFTIPAADLARFPNRCYVGLSIARAWLDNTTSSIAYIAVTEAHTVPLLVYEPPPPPTPQINGTSTVYFSAGTTNSSGQITAIPGTTVTVSVTGGGPPPGSYTVSMSVSGVAFSDGTTGITATNTTVSKTFVMPSSGSVNWGGNFSEPNTTGSGSISVQ